MQPSILAFRYLTLSGWVASSLLAAGCATTTAPLASPPTHTDAVSAAVAPTSPELPPGFVPVVRQGRYTLVEMVPKSAQRDLMQQVVDITMPPTFDATVGDALRYVLLRSGYQLCDSAGISTLTALPLPAADLHLGPLTLRDALLALAGPAWELSVDEAGRQVCFSPHAQPAPGASATQPADEPEVSPVDSATDPDPIDVLQPWGMQP